MELKNLTRANLVFTVMRKWDYYKSCFDDDRLKKKNRKYVKSLSNQCLRSLVINGFPCGY
jgi:hypothetical protein